MIFDSNRVYSRNNPQVERDFIKFLNDIENSDNIFVPQSIKQIVDRENATAPQDREYASVIQSFEKTMEIALENSESMRILLETAGQFFEEFLRRCNDPSLSNTEDMVREMTRDGFIKDDKILIQNNRAFLKKIVKMKKNKKPMENMAIDRMQIIYSMISNIYHARAAHTNKTITVNVTNDKDFRTL